MQTIVVQRIVSKSIKTGGTMTALYDEKGTRFSGFLPELQDVKEGDKVEMDVQVDGKYLNIMAVKILEHGEADAERTRTEVVGKGYQRDDPDVRRRSMALSYAKDLAVADKIKVGVILHAASEFDAYLRTGKAVLSDADLAAATTDKSAPAPKAVEPSPTFKHVGDLMTAASRLKDPSVGSLKVLELAAVKTAGEIKDFAGVWAKVEAWHAAQPKERK